MRRHSGRLERKSELLASRRLANLGSTVNDLFQKAVQNEEILRRYQQFELQLLDLAGLDGLLDLLLRNSIDYFQLDCVELWLYDPQGTLEELLSEDYLSTAGLRLLQRADALHELYGSQPQVRLVSAGADRALPALAGIFADRAPRSAALLPLVRHGVIVGSLHLGASGQQRFTNDKSTDFIAHLASVIAVCLENAVNQERLHRLSMYDMLTQVKNRRAFHQALDKEVSRATRNGDPLSLIFVDIDYFKRVNDTYGHPMGDRVLREVARHIDDMLRKTDHVCRYGGEEFALILPNCSRQRAMDIAERIRWQISELVVEEEPHDSAEPPLAVSVTLSMGVCCWLPTGELDDEAERAIARQLVVCSDRGVYQSKAEGRNCVRYIALDGAEPATIESESVASEPPGIESARDSAVSSTVRIRPRPEVKVYPRHPPVNARQCVPFRQSLYRRGFYRHSAKSDSKSARAVGLTRSDRDYPSWRCPWPF